MSHPHSLIRFASPAVIALTIGFVPGCSPERSSSDERGADRAEQALVSGQAVLVDASVQYQSITGFGASSAWYQAAVSEARADEFFSETKGLGLTLLRLRIAPDGTTVEGDIAAKAHARGVKIWAAPWSPPGGWKTSGTDTQGGSLLPEYYDDWADRLATFAKSQADLGRPLFALSAQNEPNWTAEWETCVWSPSELVTFVRDYLGPALREKSPGTKLIGPETIDWLSIATYADALLADEAARNELGIVAVHSYGGAAYQYTAPAIHGKEFWQTEVSYHSGVGMAMGLETAQRIHDHLTIAEVNAWHYWWLMSSKNDGLMKDGVMARQGYALGQFSKFIRPGAVRIDAYPVNPATGVKVSAFAHAETDRVVIVAINASGEPVEQTFTFAENSPEHVTPFVTSETKSIEPQEQLAVDTSFTYQLAPASITTFVSGEVIIEQPDPGAGGAGGAGGDSGQGGEAGEAAAGSDAGGAAGEGGAAAGASGDAGAGGSASPEGGRGGTPPEPIAGTTGDPVGGSPGAGGTHGGSSSIAGGGHGGPITPIRRGPVVSPLGCQIGPAHNSSPASVLGVLLAAFGLTLRRKRR